MSSNKHWGGNKATTFKTVGASNHSSSEREENDYYATEPVAGEWLVKLVDLNKELWECACGEGHLSKVFVEKGFNVRSSDLIDRKYGQVYDFLCITNQHWHGDIATNPPFKYAKEFILKALQVVDEGAKVCLFMKVQFMESKGRKHMFRDFPPKHIFVTCTRIICAKNGEFYQIDEKGQRKKIKSAMSYAWYVWEKGFKGDTTVKWFN